MKTLINQAVKGDVQAMTALCDSSKSLVQTLCRSLLLEEQEAGKVTVAVFQTVLTDLIHGRIDTEEEFARKAARQAVMRCKAKTLNVSSRAFRVPVGADFTAFPCDPEGLDLEGTPVEIVLRNLPPLHRFLYVMDAIGGYGPEEMARIMNTTQQVVKKALEAQEQNIRRILTAAKMKKDVTVLSREAFRQALEEAKTAAVPETVNAFLEQRVETLCRPIAARERKKRFWKWAGIAAAVLALGAALAVTLPQEEDPNVRWEQAGATEATQVTQATEETTGPAPEEPGIYADITVADYGAITVRLDEEAAPETVANFVSLAQAGFYDGLTFHRIMDGFMIQGGDPNGDGTGGSETTIPGEFSDNGYDNPLSHTRGAISMARSSDYDSASSQFFIVQSDSTYLDGQYAAFGYVTQGMEVVDAICEHAEPTDDNGTIEADRQPVISSIVIRTVEDDPAEPESTETQTQAG